MAFGLTVTGFIPKDLVTIRGEIDASLRAAFGDSIDLSDGSILGQLAAITAERYALLWELSEAVNSSIDPDKATGAELEAICALTGTTRNPATKSTVTGTLTGSSATNVPAGSVASVDTTEAQFVTLAGATITAVAAWASATAYALGDRVKNDGQKIYQCVTAGTSAGSGGPTGTGTGITDNTCVWDFLGTGTGAIDVAMEAATTGPTIALARTLTTIDTPVAGWEAVINVLDATEGTAIETDAALRLRREEELAAAGSTTIDALRSALLDIANVTNVKLFVNNTDLTDPDGVPPHAVEALVQGGADQAIWDALLANVAAGIATHGTESGTSTDSEGNDHTMKFSRPDEIEIYIIVTLSYDADLYPADGDTQIKAAIVARGDLVLPGKDAVSSAIKAWCFDVPGVLDVSSAKIGTAPAPTLETTIAIALRQLATYDTSRISVISSPATP